MNEFVDYTNLEVWIESRKLTLMIYTLTKDFPSQEIYGLTSQIRKCSISIPSNIAEGIGRQHQKEKIHFFHISRGSLFELETQLFLSWDLKFINDVQLEELQSQIVLCKKLINGFIRYLNKKI